MIQGAYIPKLGTNFTLTHALAITQTGLQGAFRALALPKDGSSSKCPRLRVPSGLALSPHSSRSRRYLTASVMCAANAMLLYGLYKVVDITLRKLPTGDAMSYLYSCFSDVYTIVYLSIMTRHAVIDRSDPHLAFATGRDQLELEERHIANNVDAQGAELS
ncbi:hypothetical protein PENSPDRAFT_650963 [Peniophora sp. CONT]|nr:hypothetical protein PENSPDRAFT_650963 [Peniophora sp. CONT]